MKLTQQPTNTDTNPEPRDADIHEQLPQLAAASKSLRDLLNPLSDDLSEIATELNDDDEYLSISLDWDDDLASAEEDGSEWDEPEPLAEYESELRQPLYIFDEDDDDALGIDLHIDQWISTKLGTATSDQRTQIAELLGELGRNRLRRWIPWLNKQEWTAGNLLLFLRFRLIWDLNPHWWESTFWDWRSYCWYPTRSRYNLSLADSYELIHRRVGHSPNEIIDEAWLGDWLKLALWKCGFLSFASFAVFRAGFENSENWQRNLDWNAVDSLSRDGELVDRRINGYRCYRYGPPLWFDDQDWYDPCEWHDNLGW